MVYINAQKNSMFPSGSMCLPLSKIRFTMTRLSVKTQNVLQQQHVNVKIADALMRKGTNNNCRVWSSEHKAWCDMVLHLPHAEGGFGVTPNAITRFAAFYTSSSRLVAWMGRFPAPIQYRVRFFTITLRGPPPPSLYLAFILNC